jgi:hypothetical protein
MCLDRVFDDKRLAVGLLMFWMLLVIVVFKDIGLLDSKFMTFGPSPGTVFMGVTLDTWYKWNIVAVFTLVNTLINDFMSDALSLWILNTITDHKTKYIPYPKAVCLAITQCWAVYCNLMGVLGLFLAMTQIDFVMIRMAADVTVNMYTTLKFMRFKETCMERYTMSMGVRRDAEMSRFGGDGAHTPMLDEGAPSNAVHVSSPGVFSVEDDVAPTSPPPMCDRCTAAQHGGVTLGAPAGARAGP